MNDERNAFSAGTGVRAWTYMGCHSETLDGVPGYRFRVWAPNAAAVSLMGDFNAWSDSTHPMFPVGNGIWECFQPGLNPYDCYKYAIHTADGRVLAKADPYAFHAETRPGTASKIYDLSGYAWEDKAWLAYRKKHQVYHSPMNIYEVHLGSWRRTEEGVPLSYRELARYLVPYVKELGYTHVELMPITEFPYDGSWGYQCTGYFAATSRYGTPHDFMYLVDELHKAGVGVILDWVPAHFPKDAFGLYEFDGGPTYEYADLKKGEHADWGTRVFDYARNEVRSFLFSSAMFWLEEYHIDGLRVDAVASMLYLDYGREDGQWTANQYGGHENLEAVDFFRRLNEALFLDHPDILMIAEESTAWPKVTHPTSEGGLGFNLKWNMGWMNDIQHYIKLDPYFRQFNHKDLTFSFMYAFSEKFMLPMSHDEVVHLKGSLLEKMPGTDEQRYAGVRAFLAYMLTHPGKKLLFMGSEFGQWHEWQYEHSLDWHLLEQQDEDGDRHRQLHAFVKAANAFYLAQPPLWELDFSWEGFEWICADDQQANTAAFLRKDKKGRFLVVICNLSPVARLGYAVGVPCRGTYQELFNTDRADFGGQGTENPGDLLTIDLPCHGRPQQLVVDLPPLGAVILGCTKKKPPLKAKKSKPTSDNA